MQAILRRRQCSPECRVSRGAPGSADCPNYSAREGVRPTRSRGAAPAAWCSAPAPCHMLSPSSGAPAPAPRVNPPEGGERCRACLTLPLGDPRVPAVPVLPHVPAVRGRRRVYHPQSPHFDLARSPPGRCHYLHVTAFYFCLGVMKEVSFPWNLISRLRLSD